MTPAHLRLVVLVLCICLLPSLQAASRQVGEFWVPDTLKWERDKEADAAYEGHCLVVTSADKSEALVVLERQPSPCGAGAEQDRQVSRMLKVFEKTCGGKLLTLQVAGQTWRGYRSDDKEEGTSLYMGLIVNGGKTYRVYIVRNELKALPADLLRFLGGLQLGKPKPELRTQPPSAVVSVPAPKGVPAWVSALPSVPTVEPVRLGEPLDFSACTKAQYDGAVRSAREACRELVGRLDEAQRRAFDAKWEPMLDHPAPQCREYLGKLIPLLEQALSLKGAIAENLLLNKRLWEEAGYAAAYDEQAGATLMRAVARQAGVLRSLKLRADAVASDIAALGEPPDLAQLKADAARKHRRSLQSLSSLLGGKPQLEGAYAYKGLVELHHQSDDPTKPYLDQRPYRANEGYSVFLPVADAGGGRVWFYVYDHREKERPMERNSMVPDLGLTLNLDFGDDDLPFYFLLMEPQGDAWVSYDWDAESPRDFEVTYYRPSEDGLIVENYNVQRGKYFSAESRRFERVSKDSVDIYPGGYGEQKVRKLFDEHRADLADMLKTHEGGLRCGEAFLSSKGAHPRIPRFGSLYWVLKDSSTVGGLLGTAVVDTFPGGEVCMEGAKGEAKAGRVGHSWVRKKYEFKDQVKGSSGREPGPGQVMISDPNSEFIAAPDDEGPGISVSTQRVLVSEQSMRAEVLWSPMPLIVPDGGALPLHIHGDGHWQFMFSPLRDKGGAPTLCLKAMANHDSLFLFGREPEDWTTWAPKEDGALMEIDSRKQGTRHERYIGLRSGDIGLGQRDFHVLVGVKTEAGWAVQDSRYVLTELEESEAEDLFVQTSRQGEQAKAMLAKYERQAGKRETKAVQSQQRASAMEQEHALRQERAAFHEANVAFYKQEAENLRRNFEDALGKMKRGAASPEDLEAYNMAQFRLACAQSSVISEQDALHAVQTGEQRFSRTPFDDLCRQQMRLHAAQEVRRFDDASRARRKAEMLARKLGGEQGRKAQDMIDVLLKDGAALEPEKMNRLNTALQNIYQGGQQSEIAAIDEELAWRSCQLQAAENIKAGADAGMVACSLFGGPAFINVIYQTTTGSIEGGPLEGAKRGLTTFSDAADVAVSGYEGYKSGGFWGMVENASWSIILNKGPEAALNRLNLRLASKADAPGTPGAKGGAGHVPQPPANAAALRKSPVDLSPTRAAQFQQELEYGESLAEDFFSTHARLRTAELKGGASAEELASLRTQVRQKAAAVAHSMPAKSYLKYKAPAAKGRAYTVVMEDILDDATRAYNWEMRNKGYNEQELFSCRNASSMDTGMDADMALRQKPDVLPVRGADGKLTYKRNEWLTKDGKPVSLVEYQRVGSKTFQEAYKKVTGGYQAKSSFVDMTTSIGAESYPDLTWLKLPKAGKHDDLTQVARKMDAFFGKIDPGATPDSLRITAEKADIMFRQHPELRPLGSMMEACRGTAKDLDTKFIPLLDHKLRALESKPAAQRTPSEVRQIGELREAKAHLSQCLEAFKDIGQGRIPPHEWQRRFKLVTGGDDVPAMIRQLTTITINATH